MFCGVCHISGQNALQAEDFEPKTSPGDNIKDGQREATESGEGKLQRSSPQLDQGKSK